MYEGANRCARAHRGYADLEGVVAGRVAELELGLLDGLDVLHQQLARQRLRVPRALPHHPLVLRQSQHISQ